MGPPLVSWKLWKECIDRVFNISPAKNVTQLVTEISEEGRITLVCFRSKAPCLYRMAGTEGCAGPALVVINTHESSSSFWLF